MNLNPALMLQRSRTHLLAVCLLIVMLTLGSGIAAQDAAGGVLKIGTNAPVQLNPQLGTNDSEVLFNRSIYDYLVDVLPDNSFAPNLATEWTISDDGLTYTFTLQEGVTFHDGSTFEAADVVYTFNLLVETGSLARNLLGEFTVEAPDASTVVFTLAQPNADFLYGVGSRWSVILNEGAEPGLLINGPNPYVNFNGTGPFILTDYSPSESATLTANENYWKDGQPMLAGVEFVFIEDPVAQANALLAGEVNFIFKVPVEQLPALESSGTITILERATNQHAAIRLRTDEGFAGADPNVRRAVELAIDRDELNDIVTEGRGVVGNNDPIGPAFGLFYDDSVEKPQYDPAAACELIAGTGQDRLSLEFYVPDALGYPTMATIMRDQMAQGCIDIEIFVRPENIYYSDNEYLDVEFGLTGWGDRPTPQQYLVDAYTGVTEYNESRFSTPELDELITQAGQTADIEARAEIYSQIARIFADNDQIIVPYFAPIIGAVTNNVEGLEIAPFPGLTDLRTVQIVSE